MRLFHKPYRESRIDGICSCRKSGLFSDPTTTELCNTLDHVIFELHKRLRQAKTLLKYQAHADVIHYIHYYRPFDRLSPPVLLLLVGVLSIICSALFRLITHNYRSTRQQISGHKILRMSAEQGVEKTHLDVNNSRTNDAMPPQTDIPVEFKLFDLKVSVVVPEGSPYSHEPALLPCNARVGDYFELQGELLFLPPGQGMSIYSIASVLPLLAAKQRFNAANDWMSTDDEVACPDPRCPSRLHIARTALRTFYKDGSQKVEK